MQQTSFVYELAGQQFVNHLAFDTSTAAKRPTVLVFHSFEGRNELACEYANRIAELGYVGCAIDLYGDAQVATDLESCLELMMPLFNDRLALQIRLHAALTAVQQLPQVDANQIIAMGFCFGGLSALDLARSGAAIRGAISIHGSLSRAASLPNHPISAKILVLHGYDDPQVPPTELAAFAAEMNAAQVDWQAHFFSHTQHAYTDPHAAMIGPPSMGRTYNPLSCARSWELTKQFIAESLA